MYSFIAPLPILIRTLNLTWSTLYLLSQEMKLKPHQLLSPDPKDTTVALLNFTKSRKGLPNVTKQQMSAVLRQASRVAIAKTSNIPSIPTLPQIKSQIIPSLETTIAGSASAIRLGFTETESSQRKICIRFSYITFHIYDSVICIFVCLSIFSFTIRKQKK